VSPKSRGRKHKPGRRPTRRERPVPVIAPSQGNADRGDVGDHLASTGRTPPPVPKSPSEDRELRQSIADILPGIYALAESFRTLTDDATSPLEVELVTAELLARARQQNPAAVMNLALAIAALAARYPEPHVAALVVAVHHFMPGVGTSMAVNDLVRAGVALPAWRRHLGEVTPGRAWRCRDLFGDQEAILVSFSYPQADHAVLVETTMCPSPSTLSARLSVTVDELQAALRTWADARPGHLVPEEISLQQARAALNAPLYHRHPDASPDALLHLDLVRERATCLPEPEPVPTMAPSATDRDAAVEAFLAATPPPAGVSRDVLTFWARVLVGYTAVSGSPPTRVSPAGLGHALGEYVPRTFELSPTQRAGLAPAVTAWTVWAASQQDLPQDAVDQLVAHVGELEQNFDLVQDDPELAAIRCYLADITAVTTDGAHLQRVLTLRSHAVPPPNCRRPESRSRLASDPTHRNQILAEELQAWELGANQSVPDWLAALTRVSDELWTQDPPELSQAVARYLNSAGWDPDLLGDLTELAVTHQGDRAAFLAAVLDQLQPDRDQ